MRHRTAADSRHVRPAGTLGCASALALSRPAAIGRTANGATDVEVVRDSLPEPSANLDGTSRRPVVQCDPINLATTGLRTTGRQ